MLIGDAWQMAIGQGTLSVTPLHVANAMAMIARGGKFISPMLVRDIGPPRLQRHLPLADYKVQAVHQGMMEEHRQILSTSLD